MASRMHPQKKTDDRSFPVRVFVFVPREGFNRDWDPMWEFLNQVIGRENYVNWSAGREVSAAASVQRDVTAFYFRSVPDAHEWLTRFPKLEIADGTMNTTYRSPYVPFGRGH